ncbi:MAG: hypothetical protein DMG00_25315 [Acidobacteria bacterium]|nr:MAG: hypothetical protein DMG00_25315 [Acidobacteriota bacterium]
MATQTDIRRRASTLQVVLKVLALTMVLFVCFSVAGGRRCTTRRAANRPTGWCCGGAARRSRRRRGRAAQTYMARVGLGERSGQYGAFLAALAWRRAGQPARADAALAAAEAAIPERTWTASVLQFLQGRLDADRLIAAAKITAEKTEAHTYVGFRQVAGGAHDAARAHFKWVVRARREELPRVHAREERARTPGPCCVGAMNP